MGPKAPPHTSGGPTRHTGRRPFGATERLVATSERWSAVPDLRKCWQDDRGYAAVITPANLLGPILRTAGTSSAPRGAPDRPTPEPPIPPGAEPATRPRRRPDAMHGLELLAVNSRQQRPDSARKPRWTSPGADWDRGYVCWRRGWRVTADHSLPHTVIGCANSSHRDDRCTWSASPQAPGRKVR